MYGNISPSDMKVRDCSQDDGFHEFACFAEAIIAAEEYKAWARAESVEEYLKFRCSSEIFPVHANRKLKDYWESEIIWLEEKCKALVFRSADDNPDERDKPDFG